jgi:hypothetical protein
MANIQRGGARHFAKPYVDAGILFKVLEEEIELVKNLGAYELISKNNSPDPHGLVHALPLWERLLKVEASGEIHSQPMRTALLDLLAQNPELNSSSRHSGQVWVNLKHQRLDCILFHVRKLQREGLTVAAAKLSKSDFLKLRDGLKLLKLEDALEKASCRKRPLEKEPCTALVPVEAESKRRVLKKESSDVSLDGKGFPKLFASSPEPSPQKAKASSSPPAPPLAFSRRRSGQLVSLEKEELQDLLGIAPKKKPALGKAKAVGKAKALEKAKKHKKTNAKAKAQPQPEAGGNKRKPWLKINLVNAKKPKRTYLVGTTDPKIPSRIIVEVSAARCPGCHKEAIEEIWHALEKDSLTKAEARDFKEQLLKKWGY